MKLISNKSLSSNGLFKLKNQDWLDKQRIAGRTAAGALVLLEEEVKKGTKKTLLELSCLAEEFILKNECTPTFKNYKGFPAAVCISVNKQLVHGIPTDYLLQDGDVVKFDLGATYQGAIADSAITCIYGNSKFSNHTKLVSSCYESLMKGISAIAVGQNLGVIGHAIHKSAKGNGFSVITDYGGHGLDWNRPHAPPFVANKANPNDDIRIQAGLAIAIEPMLVPYDTSSHVSKDGWTVLTNEIGAHFEHSIFVHSDHVEILTKRDTEWV